MADETPTLFENPPQPQTPEALLQKRKHELLLSVLTTKDPKERRRLAREFADVVVEQICRTNPGR